MFTMHCIFFWFVLFHTVHLSPFIRTEACCFNNSCIKNDINKEKLFSKDYFSDEQRLYMKSKVKDMFYFGYNNYMKHAFLLDELNPIYCSGRGPDKENP